MEILLESTGIKVKGNCVIQELKPLQKIMLEIIDSERRILFFSNLFLVFEEAKKFGVA